MKYIFLIVGFFLITATVSAQNTKKVKETYYTCTMDPQIHASKPGQCPICGMDLVKKVVTKEVPSNHTHVRVIAPDTIMAHQNMPVSKEAHHIENPEVKKEDIKKAGHPVEKPAPAYIPKAVRYDLYVKDTLVNYSGKTKHAVAINGTIPGPVLTFTEGDTAIVYVHNLLKVGTTIHWHGVFLPNQFDGVPYLTQMPIGAGQTHLYKFPVIQNGTYWYHSHSELQEQSGMYGALIFKKRNEPDTKALPIVLSDWTDMKPSEVDRSLHTGTDWFAIKKGSTQSFSEAIAQGHLGTKLANEWKRMNAMDVSDVAYESFLINGTNSNEQPQFSAGDKVKLRIVNGGASTYFWLNYSGGKMTVVANDGNDVEPVEVDRLLIAVSETYDVIVTIPEDMSYEFLVTPEDRTKSASLWLGKGMKMPAKSPGKLKYFEGMNMMNQMMAMDGNLKMDGMQMSNQVMDMNVVMYPEITGEDPNAMKKHQHDMGEHHAMPGMNMPGMEMQDEHSDIVTLNYSMLRATEVTTLRNGPERIFKFDLTGNMNRYVWTLDNKTVSEADKILIRKGENVKIVLFNNTMMRHPMHLHGHDFRLLNGQGDHAPLKNVLDIMPMETDTIEFAADESGDWFFHCHILYHMMSGMGRIFSYENSPPNPEIPDPQMAQQKLFDDDRMFHFMARVGLESNGSDGEAMLANTRWKVSGMWHLGLHDMHGYEGELMMGKYMGKMQWLFPYVGFDYHYKVPGGPEGLFNNEGTNMFGQASNKLNRKAVVAGIIYTLPTLTQADIRIDSDGKLLFSLGREDIPLTPRLRFSWELNTDKEYMAGFRYVISKYFSLSTHWDSDMGWGGGMTFTY